MIVGLTILAVLTFIAISEVRKTHADDREQQQTFDLPRKKSGYASLSYQMRAAFDIAAGLGRTVARLRR